jgi:hypothetical protein
LQSALDSEEVSINAAFRRNNRATPLSEVADYPFPEAEAGAKAVGIPGYVKQGDLLTTLGPLITVRGDTFLIRAYGEDRDASGKVLARAMCEATVQRFPEYLDPADEATEADPKSKANQEFGRRFRLTSFRWLDPDTQS